MGLKFCPTPPAPNTGQLRQDLDRLHNRMRQISFFDNRELDTDLSTSFRNATIEIPLNPMGTHLPFKHLTLRSKSKWRCPSGPPNLEAMIVCNEQQFDHRPNFRPSHRTNLSPNETLALKELCNNRDIAIKPADKGSAVVIMQRKDYLKEGYRQQT